MSFAPPPDYTKVFLAATIGAALALTTLFATRNTAPHVGDNIHHLPHGGLYQDGNKRIAYAGPGTGAHSRQHFLPAIAVVLLTLGIIISERFKRPTRSCRC
uniref:Triple gene block protein 2 n=1 Tax=Allexivirus sigmamedicagonis TaxID=1985968 RepID=A0A6M3RAT6_9VIRU|nr:triple gene block protein 2 [Alfalfa virus S]